MERSINSPSRAALAAVNPASRTSNEMLIAGQWVLRETPRMSQSTSRRLQELVSDLRRRQVFKAAAVYGAAGYVLVEAADVFVPALLLPAWIVTAVAFTVVLGFPLAIALAWVFDIGPEGARRENDGSALTATDALEADARPVRATPRVGLASWLLVAAALLGTGLIASVMLNTLRTGSAGREEAAGGVAVVDLDSRKLAVLPFRNLAGPDDAAFAEGVQDDILTRLQRIRTLKVMTRQSVLEFAETALSTREIADQLGARYLLTGTVQRAADRLRINVQLADALTEEMRWTERFDEMWSIETLFDVQSRIAEEVAAALRVSLTEAEREAIARNSTSSLEAYDLMLRAEQAYGSGYGSERAAEAVELARRSVEIDPEFGLGWAMLALGHAVTYHQGYDRTPARLALARAAIDTALALEPQLAEAHTALGYYHYWGSLDYEAALEEFAIAERIAPSSRWVLTGIAAVRRRQGRMEEALAYFERARELEPANTNVVAAVGETLFLLRRYEEAAQVYGSVFETDAIDGSLAPYQALILLNRDESIEAARAAVRDARQRGFEGESLDYIEFRVELLARDAERALAALEGAAPVIGDLQYYYYPRELARGWALRLAGDTTAARDAFEAAAATLEAARAGTPQDARIAGALGLSYAALGRREAAIAAATRATELMPIEREAWRGATRLEELARVYAEFGDGDAAIPILRRLLEAPGELSPTILRMDPAFDPIRDDPRFAALVTG